MAAYERGLGVGWGAVGCNVIGEARGISPRETNYIIKKGIQNEKILLCYLKHLTDWKLGYATDPILSPMSPPSHHPLVIMPVAIMYCSLNVHSIKS